MGYLVCDICKEEFYLKTGENKENFDDKCDECGGKLHYVEIVQMSRKEKRSRQSGKIERISKKEKRSRNQVKSILGDDYSDKVVLYGDGDSAGGWIIVLENGFLTANNQFVEYRDIISINDKTNITALTVAGILGLGVVGGVIGLATDNMNLTSLKIKYKNGTILMKNIKNANAEEFIHEIRKKIRKNKVEFIQESENPKNHGKITPIEEIEKAKSLLDNGAITKDEFQTIKEKIMKKL